MTDFPEPKSWNGDEDDRDGGFINRRTGGRQTEETMVWTRMEPQFCHECSSDIYTLYSIQGLGQFCSTDCATKASERHAAAMDPRRI